MLDFRESILKGFSLRRSNMKTLIFLVVLLASSSLFAQELSCENQSDATVINNYVLLTSRGLVKQGAVYTSKSIDVDNETGELLHKGELVVEGVLFLKYHEVIVNGSWHTKYTMAVADKVSDEEIPFLLKNTVESAEKGLSKADTKVLYQCLDALMYGN